MTILALIFVTVLGAIRVGSKSWESGEQRAEENQRTRTLFDTMALELTMVYPLRVKDQDRDVIAFRGKSDSLSFATLPLSYGAEPFSHMMRVVTYSVSPIGDWSPLNAIRSWASPAASIHWRDARGLDARVSTPASGTWCRRETEEKLPHMADYWDPSQDDAGAASLLSAASARVACPGFSGLRGSDRLPLAVEITLTIRQEKGIQGGRELVLPPLVFPVHVGRTL
jgi:hypothetical protein